MPSNSVNNQEKILGYADSRSGQKNKTKNILHESTPKEKSKWRIALEAGVFSAPLILGAYYMMYFAFTMSSTGAIAGLFVAGCITAAMAGYSRSAEVAPYKIDLPNSSWRKFALEIGVMSTLLFVGALIMLHFAFATSNIAVIVGGTCAFFLTAMVADSVRKAEINAYKEDPSDIQELVRVLSVLVNNSPSNDNTNSSANDNNNNNNPNFTPSYSSKYIEPGKGTINSNDTGVYNDLQKTNASMTFRAY